VLPLTGGIRDGVVQLVSTLGSAVISARAELSNIITSALPVAGGSRVPLCVHSPRVPAELLPGDCRGVTRRSSEQLDHRVFTTPTLKWWVVWTTHPKVVGVWMRHPVECQNLRTRCPVGLVNKVATGSADVVMLLSSARAEMTALPKVDTNCTTPSLIPPVNGNTVRSFSTHGHQSAAKGSSTTVSRSEIRLIRHFDSSTLGLVRRKQRLIGYYPLITHPSAGEGTLREPSGGATLPRVTEEGRRAVSSVQPPYSDERRES
jgi:hypothetical protein